MYRFKSGDIGKKFYLAGYITGKNDGEVVLEVSHSKVYSSISDVEKAVVASDNSEDRHGEIVNAEGWILDQFKKNSVMLWAHDNYVPAIGVWTNPRFENRGKFKALVVDPKFDTEGEGDEADRFARLIAGKVNRGIIKAVSVGFMPLEFDRDFNSIKQELLEISWVNIGANRNALNEAKDAAVSEAKVVAQQSEKRSEAIEEYLIHKHSTVVT